MTLTTPRQHASAVAVAYCQQRPAAGNKVMCSSDAQLERRRVAALSMQDCMHEMHVLM